MGTKRRAWTVFQVACTYVGTVVGAGFASGQEVFQFFARFGNVGYWAIGATTLLFGWLGYCMMDVGARLRARSYREMNRYLFGRRFGGVMNGFMLVMLFGVTVAMVAGAGALVQERAHVPFDVGALLTVGVTFLTIFGGIAGVKRANAVIVPVMVSFVLGAALYAAHTHGWQAAWQAGQGYSLPSLAMSGISAILYGALNCGLAAGVLVPLGADVGRQDRAALRWGAWFGAAGLGVMLAAVMFTLYTFFPEDISFSVPMGYVASQMGPRVQWLFVLVLWCEIYSTLVGNAFALGAQFDGLGERRQTLVIAATLFVAYVLSHLGFRNLVAYGYTAFAWVSCLILFGFIGRRSAEGPGLE
ncbi:MAG: hypothetical protein K6T78_09400 [Alicyclobacillus sp.]|nr:hypothetical protein [Alicyclobacillus sp.]